MTYLETMFGERSLRGRRQVQLFLVLAASALAVGLLGGQEPLLAVAAALGFVLALATLAWPDLATLAVVFILYTNAATVAVRFHGLPFFMGAFVPVLLVIPIASYLFFRQQKLIVNEVVLLIGLYLLVQSISALLSENLSVTFDNIFTFLIEGLGIYVLILNAVRTPEMLRRVIWVLLLAGTLMGALSFHQQVTQTFDNNYWGFAQVGDSAATSWVSGAPGEVEQERLAGPIGEKNYYAQVMLMLVPIGMFRFWGERSKWLRLLAAIATIFICIGAALTFSRGGAVGFVLMLAIMVFLRYIKPYQIAVLILGLALLVQVIPDYYTARLLKLQALSSVVAEEETGGIENADQSIQGRVTEMLAAARAYADHPVLGVGPGMFKFYYQQYAEQGAYYLHLGTREAHNLYLDIGAETGTFGLLCFLAIVFVTLRGLARARQRWLQSRPETAHLVTGLMLAIINYLTTGIFLSIAYARYFWLMMALCGAAIYIANTKTEATGLEQSSTRSPLVG